MAFCAWCSNPVAQVSYTACPRCGNPTNGAQRVAGAGGSGGKTVAIIVGVIVGGFVLVAVIGIIAAIAIPNLLTAAQRSRQKRSMADMRSIGTAIEAYASDKDALPQATYVAELKSALSPGYTDQLPEVDGWGTALRYQCWPAGECTNYAILSAGADKAFEYESAEEYAPDTKTTDFNNDIVYANGKFVQYPEGAQQ